MQLIIQGSKLLQQVQQEFNASYPFLKIEFFRPFNSTTIAASASNMLKHSLKISEARRRQFHDGVMDISDLMKVSELEKEFREKHGLYVQVFRKSGNVWLETTMSDDWSLKRQNEHGLEITNFARKKSSEE